MIEPEEILLEGKWAVEGTKIVADHTARRIEVLLSEHLKKVISSLLVGRNSIVTPMMVGYGS
jgi:hypothetical protein